MYILQHAKLIPVTLPVILTNFRTAQVAR